MKVAGLFGSMSLTPSGPSAEPMFVAHKCALAILLHVDSDARM